MKMSIEAMKQALEALEETTALNENWVSIADRESLEHLHEHRVVIKMGNTTITALRAAIAEQEKAEPQYFGLTSQHTWLSVSKEQYERLRESYRSIFFTHPAPVPAGWQLVPVEPTEEMMVLHTHRDDYTFNEELYKAMLQAAPKPGEMK
jgi:hypothetical protein